MIEALRKALKRMHYPLEVMELPAVGELRAVADHGHDGRGCCFADNAQLHWLPRSWPQSSEGTERGGPAASRLAARQR